MSVNKHHWLLNSELGTWFHVLRFLHLIHFHLMQTHWNVVFVYCSLYVFYEWGECGNLAFQTIWMQTLWLFAMCNMGVIMPFFTLCNMGVIMALKRLDFFVSFHDASHFIQCTHRGFQKSTKLILFSFFPLLLHVLNGLNIQNNGDGIFVSPQVWRAS